MSLFYEIHHHAGRWVVRLCNKLYGEYLTREQAYLDAVEAATEARQAGNNAEVWDRSTRERLL